MRRRLVIISLPLAAAWIAGLYYWLSGSTRSRTFEHLLPLAVILGPIEVALISLSGFRYDQYFLAILPVSSVLIAFLVRFLTDQRLVAPILVSSALLLGVLYYLIPYRRVAGLIDKYAHVDEITVSVEDHRLIADRIREETGFGRFDTSMGRPRRRFTPFPKETRLRGSSINTRWSNPATRIR